MDGAAEAAQSLPPRRPRSRAPPLLATSWFSSTLEACKRWMPARGERAAVDTSLALRVYHRYYNLVDRLNKKIAAMNMGMARCKKRYQRQLYIGWLLPAVARNVNVLFQCLWPEMAALRAATCSWRTCSR